MEQQNKSVALTIKRLGKNIGGSVCLISLVAGCATQGYDRKATTTVDAMKSGNAELALQALEQQNPDKDKDLLYFMEKGELLRMKGSYEASKETWLAADEKVRGWEDQVKTDPSKLMGDIGSLVLNDTTRRYDGRDYEKVFINLRLALDHLAIGDWDSARTEIKKMHEREAIIADFRSKELDAAKSSAESKGLKTTSFKELNGYPVETLEDPAVRALKNSYESAFANYLAGFVYEGLGEPSLAAERLDQPFPGFGILVVHQEGVLESGRGARRIIEPLQAQPPHALPGRHQRLRAWGHTRDAHQDRRRLRRSSELLLEIGQREQRRHV